MHCLPIRVMPDIASVRAREHARRGMEDHMESVLSFLEENKYTRPQPSSRWPGLATPLTLALTRKLESESTVYPRQLDHCVLRMCSGIDS